MTKAEIKEVLRLHRLWLQDEPSGVRADLRGADLSGADLRSADLRGADLRGADLSSGIVQVGPIGSRKDYTIYRIDEDIVQCGCWHGAGKRSGQGGTLDEFIDRVNFEYDPDTKHGKEYRAVIEYFKILRREAAEHD